MTCAVVPSRLATRFGLSIIASVTSWPASSGLRQRLVEVGRRDHRCADERHVDRR